MDGRMFDGMDKFLITAGLVILAVGLGIGFGLSYLF